MNSNLPTGLQTLTFSQQCRSQIYRYYERIKSIDALYNQIGWVDEGKVAHRGKVARESKQTLQFYATFSKISAMVCGILLAFIGTLVYFRFNYEWGDSR